MNKLFLRIWDHRTTTHLTRIGRKGLRINLSFYQEHWYWMTIGKAEGVLVRREQAILHALISMSVKYPDFRGFTILSNR